MVLETTFKDNSVIYHELGEIFTLIEKDVCKYGFEKTAKELFPESEEHLKKDAIGFVVIGYGKHVEPLYKDFKYRILNNNGGVFLRII